MDESVELRKSVDFIYDFPEMQSMSWINFHKWINDYKTVNSNFSNFSKNLKKIAGLNHLDRLYKLMNVSERSDELVTTILG